jgi:cyclopropane fatty-acyl-phospholipid synthase-like methyltransferase
MNHSASLGGRLSKFSKSSTDINFRAENFIKSNTQETEARLLLNSLYIQQPERTCCKVCKSLLIGGAWFKNHGIRYILCPHCGHLNGEYQDTPIFANELYTDGTKSTYDTNYNSDFDLRVKQIYLPKVEFLTDSIGQEISQLRLLDFGCGAGHFLKAAQLRGINCIGLETNSELVNIGKAHVGENSIFKSHSYQDLVETLQDFKPHVISFIGVLEHLTDMDEVLEICKSQNVRYIYSSVPVFSLAAILQTLNENVFPRQLSGGHTHLFTDKSLTMLLGRHGYEVKADWWFGTDFTDLKRILALTLSDQSFNFEKIIDAILTPLADELQSVLDRHKTTSEVHTLSELAAE